MTDSKPLILYIDDDKDEVNLVERFLSGRYNIITAENGQEGMRIINGTKPDLILLDIMMPEIDGYEVCALLQKNDKTAFIPVIFVTAMGEEQDKAKAFSVGAADYLVKPIKKNILIEIIETHLKTTAYWEKMGENSTSWYEKAQPVEFIRFKEFISGQLDMGAEDKKVLSKISSSDIYSISPNFGIAENVLSQLMSRFLKLPYADFIDPGSIRLGTIPAAFCRTNNVLPINDASGKKAFIISNPFNWKLMDMLIKFCDLDRMSNIIITAPGSIDSFFSETRQKSKAEFQASKNPVAEGSSGKESTEHPIVHITNVILNAAVNKRASDIHIEPKEKETEVKFRIDGEVTRAFTLQKETGVKVISRLKIKGGLDIAEKRKPQDGSFAVKLNNKIYNLRLSTTSTPNGESLVMRLLEPYATPKTLYELGMSDKQIDTLIGATTQSQGLILIVGATGSGKTTTIYSLLHAIDHEKRSIMSVEDPTEYRMPFVNQQQVNEKAGVTFEALLKASVRQDPDVLFMGEVRDGFSAKMAFDFASTGHLTITSLHTSNATTAIFRLERLGIERGTMADTLIAVVAQKLLKKLCPHCKKISPISPAEAEMFAAFTNNIPSDVANPVGCPECNGTGYFGREGIYEVLEFDQEIAEMVRTGAPISGIRAFLTNRGDFLISTHAISKARELVFAPKDIFQRALAEEKSISKARETNDMVPEIISTHRKKTSQDSILLVEDDEDTRKLVARYLEMDGFCVTVSEDGIDALLNLGKNNFDLILSDINMPNLDGFKLLEMVNQKGINTPVIFLTSRTNSQDEEAGLRLGAKDYIKKPIKKDLLLLRVKRIIEERDR